VSSPDSCDEEGISKRSKEARQHQLEHQQQPVSTCSGDATKRILSGENNDRFGHKTAEGINKLLPIDAPGCRSMRRMKTVVTDVKVL
jgi:hypothetical protein